MMDTSTDAYNSVAAQSSLLLGIAYLVLGVAETMIRAVRIVWMGSQQLHVDVRCCWRPVAESVFSGTPLYVRPAVDNKPPGFELLNLLVFSTDHYVLLFLALVGLANGATALLLWRYGCRLGEPRVGAVAGLLFIGTVPIVGATVINVRSFAVVALLVAVHTSHPVFRGAAIAVGSLFSQYAILAVPALIWAAVRGRSRRDALGWMAQFVLAGVGVVTVAFLVLWAIWGPETVVQGLKWSYVRAIKYTSNPDVPSLRSNRGEWLVSLFTIASRILFILLPALVVATVRFGKPQSQLGHRVPLVVLFLAGSMLLSLVVRPYRAYWLYPLPFLALLAGFGYDWLLQSDPDRDEPA